MFFLVCMMLEICRRRWTNHAANARDCRAPSQVIDFYIRAACNSIMGVMMECAAVFLNVSLLAKMGFEVDFGRGLPETLRTTAERVQVQILNAFHTVDLLSRVAFHRNIFMLWHSVAWPGELVCFTSQDPDVFEDCLRRLGLIIVAILMESRRPRP